MFVFFLINLLISVVSLSIAIYLLWFIKNELDNTVYSYVEKMDIFEMMNDYIFSGEYEEDNEEYFNNSNNESKFVYIIKKYASKVASEKVSNYADGIANVFVQLYKKLDSSEAAINNLISKKETELLTTKLLNESSLTLLSNGLVRMEIVDKKYGNNCWLIEKEKFSSNVRFLSTSKNSIVQLDFDTRFTFGENVKFEITSYFDDVSFDREYEITNEEFNEALNNCKKFLEAIEVLTN